MKWLKPVFFVSTILHLWACTSTPKTAPISTWQAIVYEGLDQELMKLELPNTHDCGFYDLTTLPINKRYAIIEKQFHCVQNTLDKGIPFKMGYTYIPQDSYLTQIYLSQKEGVRAQSVDVMLDQSDASNEVKLCKNITLNFDSLSVELHDCETPSIN